VKICFFFLNSILESLSFLKKPCIPGLLKTHLLNGSKRNTQMGFETKLRLVFPLKNLKLNLQSYPKSLVYIPGIKSENSFIFLEYK
jgi:hypothetical protein